MNLTSSKPVKNEMTYFRREMDRLRERFFDQNEFEELNAEEWPASAEISEKDDKIIVKAELPHLEAGDIDLSISGDSLTVRVEKKREKENERHRDHERYYGSFERSFHLPSGVKTDEVEAKFNGRILTVDLPKSEETKEKRVRISINRTAPAP